MYLTADDPDNEIQIYVNSPGGAVTAGLAIYDTMQYVRAPISTVCIGRAASFGTVVLMAGAKGKRYSLPSATIHMHQPLIGGKGLDRKSTRLNSSHSSISYAVFCLKKKKKNKDTINE